jgi:integrase
MPKLSDTRIRAAKPRDKTYKLFDTEGLFLVINKNGGRWWRLRYRYAGTEKLLSVGTYPDTSLALAREKRDAIHKQLAAGIDPSAHRRSAKAALVDARRNTFESIARDWHTAFRKQWSEHHAERILQRLQDNVFPWMGAKAIAEISSKDIVGCLTRCRDRGAIDTARRLLQIIKAVFAWAVTHERVTASPAAHISPRTILPAIDVAHRAAIKDPAQFGLLLRAIDAYQGSFIVKSALQLLALVFVRPGELRHARWEEISFEAKEWRIPAERMKMREHHIVPLSRQAMEILREVQPLTGADGRGYIFPSNRNASRPMSENTLNVAVRGCGFSKEQHCSHGFRGTASTLLNEQGWHRDAIERQLAHGERDKVRGSYNSAEHLPERRKMMQAWADYLTVLKAGGNVVPLKDASRRRSARA